MSVLSFNEKQIRGYDIWLKSFWDPFSADLGHLAPHIEDKFEF